MALPFERRCLLALLGLLPGVACAGLYTAPVNPTFNLGPESAWMNPAGMTGVKTNAVTVGVGGLMPLYKWDTKSGGAGGKGGGNSGVATVLPTFNAVTPIADKFRLGL